MTEARACFSVQLITICAVVKWKYAVEKSNVCTKKCRDSGQIDDLCADCKSCLKHALTETWTLILFSVAILVM